MDGLNKVMLLGNLGGDPELRTAGNTSVLRLNLACSETWFDARNQKQERTEWIRVCLFGKRAEALGKILHKGDRIFVEGGIRTSSYEKDGEQRHSTEVVATNVLLAGGRRDGNAAPRDRRPTPRAPEPRRVASHDDFDGYGNATGTDDIPF